MQMQVCTHSISVEWHQPAKDPRYWGHLPLSLSGFLLWRSNGWAGATEVYSVLLAGELACRAGAPSLPDAETLHTVPHVAVTDRHHTISLLLHNNDWATFMNLNVNIWFSAYLIYNPSQNFLINVYTPRSLPSASFSSEFYFCYYFSLLKFLFIEAHSFVWCLCCPVTGSVKQAGLELSQIRLPGPPKCWEGVSQLIECLPNRHKPWIQSPALHKLDMLSHA